MNRKYNKILLKLSGEILAGGGHFGLDYDAVRGICEEIAEVAKEGIMVSMVVGGGNIIRGAQTKYIERAQADYMGMLGTVINALALQDALESLGQPTRVQSAIEMRQIAETVIRRRAIRHLEKGRIVIFAAGTGSPYFSTDTTAGAARLRNRRRLRHKGDEGRRHIRQGPGEIPRRREAAAHHLHGRAEHAAQGHGRRGLLALPGQQHPDSRIRHAQERQSAQIADRR